MGFAPNADYTPFVTNDDNTIGGFARIATLIKSNKKTYGEKTLVLSAGDFLMGTVFQAIEPETGFQLNLMHKMGFDYLGIGNHEFDFGPDAFAQIINQANKNGSIPQLIISNLKFSNESLEDNNLENLYNSGVIKPYSIVYKNGIKIGLFSLMGYDAHHSAPFMEPASIEDPVKTAQIVVDILKETEKTDLIICLSHSGLERDKDNNWIGEDVKLAKQVAGIDLIISGHTHSTLPQPLKVNNTIIVQAGSEGKYVGKLKLSVSNNNIEKFDYNLIPVDDQIISDKETYYAIEAQKQRISDLIFSKQKLSVDSIIAENQFDLVLNEDTCLENSNLGPFMADALYYFANQVDSTGTDITLVVAGLIRDNIIKGNNGLQTPADLYRISPLGSGIHNNKPGYPIAKIHVTASELKSIMEVMLIAPLKGAQNYPYWSGVKATYNSKRVALDQVYEIWIGNEDNGYKSIDLSESNTKLYSLVANAYILEFISMIKDLSKGILSVVPKHADGNPVIDPALAVIDTEHKVKGIQEVKEWEALLAYSTSFKDINNNSIPDIPESYKKTSKRVIDEASLNPFSLLKNSNGIMKAVVAVFIVLSLLVLFFIRKRIKRINKA